VTEPIEWIGTPEACARLGVTLRTLYRFIDEGQLPAYKMGRVIRLQVHEVDAFIERARIEPGTLEHLYPDPRGHASRGHETGAGSPAEVGAERARGGDDTEDGLDEDDARGPDQEGP
jgi:excisionase family DNA binding protein